MIINENNQVPYDGANFDSHIAVSNDIASVAKKCSRLCGWILRTFSTRSKSVLLTLFKSIVLIVLSIICINEHALNDGT